MGTIPIRGEEQSLPVQGQWDRVKAVVLAGGKGTRLRPLTYTKPKPLLPLAGEPAIVRLIQKLAREGIDEVIVTTNYFARQLHATLGDGSNYGVQIHHVEEKTPLGTAGSVKNSESLIDETFVVIQGDNQFEFYLKDVLELHRRIGALATMALIQVENPSEYGIAEVSDGRVTRFLEKPRPEECFSNLINTGLYVIEPEALKLVPEGKPFDFSKNLFPLMLKSKLVLAGCRVSGFWVDMGNPRSYLKANAWALDKLGSTRAKTNDKSTCESSSAISESATLKGPVHVGRNARIGKNATVGPYACIGDESEISPGARIAFSVVYENTQIGTDATLDTCVVAENCRIGDRVQIERNTVVGAGTELGNDSHLAAESRVGPFAVVEPRALIEGTMTTFENDIERICELLEKSRTSLGLTAEEAKVCGTLSELGEADAKTVARFADVPYSRVLSILIAFQERGIAFSFGNVPKMFALTREEVSGSRKET
jgi:NDP-sugar pyrophosphorylase family protein